MLHYTKNGELKVQTLGHKTGRAFIRINVTMGGQVVFFYASYAKDGPSSGEIWTPLFDEAYAYSSREEAECLVKQLKEGEMKYSFDRQLVWIDVIDEVAID